MIKNPYQLGGPLPARSPVYIARDADEKATVYLHRMEYISLIEPRQHGKTSLINHLIEEFSAYGYTFAFRDMMAAKAHAANSAEWYTSLGKWLLRQLHFIDPTQRPEPPVDSASWEDFLAEIAERAQVADQKVVVILDEIGAVPPVLSTDFFSIIRSIYTSRQSLTFWHHLTFIIAGAFNPKELIKDATISNFNIDKRIPLDDFDITQTLQLVSHLNLSPEMTQSVAQQIYEWTGGQPFLVHWLCESLVGKVPTTASKAKKLVRESIHQFFYADTQHLECIKMITTSPDLLSYTRRITTEPRARLNAAINDKHFRLAHMIGIIKADANGYCQVRNRIYEQALVEIEQASDSISSSSNKLLTRKHIFISYCQQDKRWFDELQTMLAPRIRDNELSIWTSDRIEPGAEWQDEIKKALVCARVAVLLVTSNFLASDFIVQYQLLPLLEAAKKEGLTIQWIAISTCLYQETPIAAYQPLNDPDKPFASLHGEERQKEPAKICRRIQKSIIK